jgi:hypothetical protein
VFADLNVKLMLEGCKLVKWMTHENTQLSTYYHCSAVMTCSLHQWHVFFFCGGGGCIEYPRADKLQDLLENLKYSRRILLSRLLNSEFPQISA